MFSGFMTSIILTSQNGVKEGVLPQIDNLQNIPIGDYQVWLDELDKHKKLVINDIEEIKDTFPKGYELLVQQGIRNIIWVP